ncbi:MAG: histidine kinase, partial [Bacteroidota bacterium]
MKNQRRAINVREFGFQVLLHAVVFSFYTVNRKNPQVEWSEVFLFLNFASAALVINYYLLPRFFYGKRYLPFTIGLISTIAAVMLIEELVLEQIFFPDTRAKSFPGLFFALLYTLPVITILSGFKFGWDALNKQQQVEDLQLAVRESELQFLKSQINPHFLFNNLNNLYAYAIEQSPKTPELILELSGLMRYMLYECRENEVALEKEIDHLQSFVRLSELQIEERGSVSFEANEVKGHWQIAPLILVVFIENAFKHSSASKTEGITIQIDLQVNEKGLLSFRCRNNFDEDSNTQNLDHGIGLEN